MTLLALAGALAVPCCSSARNSSGSAKLPRAVSAPALRVSRRVSPSQNRRGVPSIVSTSNLLSDGQVSLESQAGKKEARRSQLRRINSWREKGGFCRMQ